MKNVNNLFHDAEELKQDGKSPILHCLNNYADAYIELKGDFDTDKLKSLMKDGCKFAKLNAAQAIYGLEIEELSCDCTITHYETPSKLQKRQ